MIGTALRCGLALLVLIALVYAGSGRAADQITNGTIDRLTGQVVKDGGLDRAYYRVASDTTTPIHVKSWGYAPEAITLQTPEGVTIEAERVYKIPDNAQGGPTMPKTVKAKDKIRVPKAAIGKLGRQAARLFPYAAAAWTAYEVSCALDLICWDDEEEEWIKSEVEEQPYYTNPVTVVGYGRTNPLPDASTCIGAMLGQRFNSVNHLRAQIETCAVPGALVRSGSGSTWTPAGRFSSGPGGMTWVGSTGTTTITKLGCSSTQPNCTTGQQSTAYGGVGVGYQAATPMCPEGWGLNQGVCERYIERPATDEELETAVKDREPSTWPQILGGASALGMPLGLPEDTPAEFTPTTPTVQGSPTTTTTTINNADGSTTTTTTTKQNVQSNTNSGGQTVTTNTIRIENKTVTEKETTIIRENSPPIIIREQSDENAPDGGPDPNLPPDPDPDPNNEEQPDPCENGGCEFEDQDMPEIPELYQRKYPNGIVGVFQAKWPQLQATQFIQGLTGMIPTLGGGGSCPAWSMNFDIMPHANYGSQAVPFDCSILQIVGLIILASACFTAWRIIF